MWIVLGLGAFVAVAWLAVLVWVGAGRSPRGARLARIERSPHWSGGKFHNLHATPTMTGDKSTMEALREFAFSHVAGLKPEADIPVVRTDLHKLDRRADVVVWLGHSTLLVQTGGRRFLFDPVLTSRLPVSLFMRPFRGTAAYAPQDVPDVDYLVITHDHWDHLDRPTVRALRGRVGAVVCGLGVGEHLAYWGYAEEKIHELDWGESLRVSDGLTLRCLPARHFSGRLFQRDATLWASWLIDGPRRIFVSGDGGYDTHLREIGARYPGIDLAVMENGQYNTDWRYIHMLPSLLPQAIADLGPQRVLTYHNSKFALARHPWREPLDSIATHAEGQPWQLLTPRIGEVVDLGRQQRFGAWWRTVE